MNFKWLSIQVIGEVVDRPDLEQRAVALEGTAELDLSLAGVSEPRRHTKTVRELLNLFETFFSLNVLQGVYIEDSKRVLKI